MARKNLRPFALGLCGSLGVSLVAGLVAMVVFPADTAPGRLLVFAGAFAITECLVAMIGIPLTIYIDAKQAARNRPDDPR